MNLPETISKRRKKLRLTQTDLAQIAGVGIATVKDFERGKGNPSLKTLERICTVLGFEIELKVRTIEPMEMANPTSEVHLGREVEPLRSVNVYFNDFYAGVLSELPEGKYSFRYDDQYFKDDKMPDISITLPKSHQEYVADHIFPFFTNMLPEGANRKVVCRMCKVDEKDFFGLIVAMRGADFIGAVNLR